MKSKLLSFSIFFIIILCVTNCSRSHYLNRFNKLTLKDDFIISVIDSFQNRKEILANKGKICTQLFITEDDSNLYIILTVAYTQEEVHKRQPIGYYIHENGDIIFLYTPIDKLFILESDSSTNLLKRICLKDQFQLVDYPIWQIIIDKQTNQKRIVRGFTNIYKPSMPLIEYSEPNDTGIPND